jgi:hypothetical protein
LLTTKSVFIAPTLSRKQRFAGAVLKSRARSDVWPAPGTTPTYLQLHANSLMQDSRQSRHSRINLPLQPNDNGEHWSAIAGGLGRMLELGDMASAEEAQVAIETEIAREQAVFDQVAAERDGELDLLRLAMTLAHNRGDLTQGMGFWKKTPATLPVMEQFTTRGRFHLAVRMYQETGLSAEGHRHYPLRPVKALRRSPATLLPLCPFLDDWGAVVAGLEENDEVLAALVIGCQKLKGQQGYYRAIAGMYAASPGAFDRAAARMPNATQRLLRSAEMRKPINVPRVSFESMMRKRARASLAKLRDPE